MVDVPDISVVVPVYGSDSTLVPLYKRVAAAISGIPASFELIFVDDCGPGNPWAIISKMAQNDPRVTGLKLSRNYGQHNAIMAGINLARGRWVVIMDCDLQDRPEEITRLWAKAQEGHDIVVGRRVKRQDRFFKRLSSKIFHEVIKYINNQKNDPAQATFGIYSRRVIDKIKLSSETPKIFPLLMQRTGFPVKSIDVEHCWRAKGKSSYTLKRKIFLAMDVIAFYSDKPLNIWVRLKVFAAVAAFSLGLWILVHSFLFGCQSVDWTKIISISFILSGAVFLGMGILEIYIKRIFNQLKKRSPSIVADRTQTT